MAATVKPRAIYCKCFTPTNALFQLNLLCKWVKQGQELFYSEYLLRAVKMYIPF